MGEHFAAFSFVDRISEFAQGVSAAGSFTIPSRIDTFPACLVAEAVGQLAAWVAMDRVDFRGRPVAALATETRFHRAVVPGQMLRLEVDIADCDDDAVAYSGRAYVDGTLVIELEHCLGPMLPVVEFDSPDVLRARLATLRGGGAPGGLFDGVTSPPIDITEHESAKSMRATLQVPQQSPFFADHFPRRPVFPATLLLDLQIGLARTLANEAAGAKPQSVPSRMTNVKMRAFITPGQTVELNAEKISGDASLATYALGARVAGKVVASARVDIAGSESVA